jgi:hypothetical protein
MDAKEWSIIQTYLILAGGAALFGLILHFLDLRARRLDRQSSGSQEADALNRKQKGGPQNSPPFFRPEA